MKYLLSIFLFLTFIFIAQPVFASSIAVQALPEPFETVYDQQHLIDLGCEIVPESEGQVSVPRNKLYFVTPSTPLPQGSYMFCPADAHEVIQQESHGHVAGATTSSEEGTGQVKGISDVAQNIVTGFLGNSLQALFISLYSWLVNLSVVIALWLTQLSAYFISYFLKQGQFITHPFVAGGWLVIQGLTNLGFILALLFIAGSTILNMDIAGALRRLLPRLLIAALLINFSLVIGGALIDFSRLLMAIEVNAIPDLGNVDNIGARILESSGAFNVVFYATNSEIWPVIPNGLPIDTPAQGWSVLANLMIANFIAWFVTIGLGVAAIFLFIRHIALLLLLVASPVAYLAWVFPKTKKMADRWWSEFLKYVFVGPVLLFILGFIPRISGGDFTETIAQNQGIVGQLIATCIPVLLTVGAVIGGVMATRKLGVVGGEAVVNYANKVGKRANYYGSGAFLAAIAGRRLRQYSGDAVDSAKKAIQDKAKQSTWTKWAVSAERDDKGRLKPGQDSLGSKLGKSVGGAIGSAIPGREDKARDAKNASRAFASSNNQRLFASTHQSLAPEKLVNSDYASGLSDEVIRSLATMSETIPGIAQRKEALATGLASSKNISKSQVKVLVEGSIASGDKNNGILHQLASNQSAVKNMNDAQKSALLQHGDAKLTEKFMKTVRGLNSKKDS